MTPPLFVGRKERKRKEKRALTRSGRHDDVANGDKVTRVWRSSLVNISDIDVTRDVGNCNIFGDDGFADCIFSDLDMAETFCRHVC